MNSSTLTAGLRRLRDFSSQDESRLARLNAFRREILALLAEEDATVDRYGAAAEASEAELCCPVSYDPAALSHIPKEILDIDYGCGDPTVFAEDGQTVLDLGSGSGKHCFMIAKKVGPKGRVIGIDKTPQMLEKSSAAIPEVMSNLGFTDPNVEFRCGHIENLKIDRSQLLELIETQPLETYDDLEALETKLAKPLVASESVDLVVSNCVLNLVDDERKRQLFREIFRVVKKGGGVAISDIVADRPIPEDMKQDDDLWTGCLSGAFQRHEFHQVFERAGFHGMQEAKSSFWKTVGGINFFSVTILAQKGKQGPCYETYRQALYEGPFSEIRDDDGHVFQRGLWTPVCQKTAELLQQKPYVGHFLVTPALEDPAKKIPFDCGTPGGGRDLPADIAAQLQSITESGACCTDEGCC
ncbi:MAG: methyltransferase domain-containing protein [Planctomycetota bacterium]